MAIETYQQVVFPPNLYLSGFNPIWFGNKLLQIMPGAARDYTNTTDIISNNLLSIDATKNGAGGLDTGTLSANGFYFVYVISDIAGFVNPAAMISFQSTPQTLTMPKGYCTARRIGRIYTNASSNILQFIGPTDPSTYFRYSQLITPYQVLTNGNSTSFLEFFVGTQPTSAVYLNIKFFGATAGDTLSIQPSFVNPQQTLGNCPINYTAPSNASTIENCMVRVLPGPDIFGEGSLSYAVTSSSDSVNIYLVGYEDYV